MLLGTLPIMFLIVPTVMTGAFKNKTRWAYVPNTFWYFYGFHSVVQGGAMLLAGYIQQLEQSILRNLANQMKILIKK